MVLSLKPFIHKLSAITYSLICINGTLPILAYYMPLYHYLLVFLSFSFFFIFSSLNTFSFPLQCWLLNSPIHQPHPVSSYHLTFRFREHHSALFYYGAITYYHQYANQYSLLLRQHRYCVDRRWTEAVYSFSWFSSKKTSIPLQSFCTPFFKFTAKAIIIWT